MAWNLTGEFIFKDIVPLCVSIRVAAGLAAAISGRGTG